MMNSQERLSETPRLRLYRYSAFLILIIIISAVACGGSDGDSSQDFVRVIESEKTYSLDDLSAIGYRDAKSYDVNGLVGASAAYYGFWRVDSSADPVDYEIRVYPSHTVAVESGTAQAEEVTGEDAVLNRDLSSWPEGLSDRRKVVGPGASQGSGQPRYEDYVILGNLVILCDGLNLEHAQEQCTNIVNALR